MLIEGKPVTLDNGTVVTPEMVMGSVKRHHDFLSINLSDAAQIPHFLQSNAEFINKVTDPASIETENRQLQLVYHSMPLSCFTDGLY